MPHRFVQQQNRCQVQGEVDRVIVHRIAVSGRPAKPKCKSRQRSRPNGSEYVSIEQRVIVKMKRSGQA
jgi:hypothetical protein